jgi:hypothetical protein
MNLTNIKRNLEELFVAQFFPNAEEPFHSKNISFLE